MKSVLISIQPKWCELIASGKKTVEVRKTAPKEVPFKAYIYATKPKARTHPARIYNSYIMPESGKCGSGKVVGEFVCDKVIKTCGWRLRGNTGWCAKRTEVEEKFPTSACLTIDEIVEYAGGEGREVSGWHISELKIYDEPKELTEFQKLCPFNYKCDLYCPHAMGEYHGDGINGDVDFVGCGNNIHRPPQSWCYVEEN